MNDLGFPFHPSISFRSLIYSGISSNRSSTAPTQHQVPTTIVCFLGGVTYAEIAALRFLNKQTPGKFDPSL